MYMISLPLKLPPPGYFVFSLLFFKAIYVYFSVFFLCAKILHMMYMNILFFLNNFGLRSSIFTLIPQCLQQIVFKPRVML